MQTGYELVRRAIEFDRPDRVPFNFDECRTDSSNALYGDDFIWVFVYEDPNFKPAEPGTNEFGVRYDTIDASFGQAKTHPLSNLEKLAEYKIPDFSTSDRYKAMAERIAENPDKYALAMFPHFLFMTAMDLLGFETLMLETAVGNPDVEKLFDILTESCLKVIDQCASQGVHGMIAIEDLGMQDRLIFSPPMFRQLLKPRYKKIFDHAHQKGVHTFMHSCGYIKEIIPDLIEVGLDVLQLDQQDNMGMDTLAELGRGKTCFYCPVDIQSILNKPENHSQIEQRVKELITKLGTKNGGFIAKTYPQPDAINIPQENTAYMCEMFKKYSSLGLK